MTVTIVFPTSFSASMLVELNGSLNASTPALKACTLVVKSAGLNVANANPQCIDQSSSRFAYSSSLNSTVYDQLVYDYGIVTNLGLVSTTYAPTANTVV